MEQDQDFSQLRKLLALNRLEMPSDTQVDQFLIEFHRRQRAQLLVRQSVWARTVSYLQERVAGFQFIPSLSYASVVAAIALVAFVGLSQQVQVTQVGGQSKLSLRMPGHDTSFAMISSLLGSPSSAPSKVNDVSAFTPTSTHSPATRYVLANNSPGAYDATVAF
jgi:hypothetical protein